MNKRAEKLTLGGLVLAILLFIGLCIMVIWALSGTPNNDVNNAAIGFAWMFIGYGVLFLLLIALIVILVILVKKAQEQ